MMGAALFLVVACSTKNQIIGGPIYHDKLEDGIYEGAAVNGPVKVKAVVTVSDQKIANINLVEHRTWKGGAAEGIIPHRIIESQSTKVDAVSGATISSVAIMNAVEVALQNAQ